MNYKLSFQERAKLGLEQFASYLKDGEKTSSAIEDTKRFKSEETKRLEGYVTRNNFWVNGIDSYWLGFAIL